MEWIGTESSGLFTYRFKDHQLSQVSNVSYIRSIKPDEENTLLIASNEGILVVNSYGFVKVGDIIRCEEWGKYTKLHLKDGTCLVSSYNLGIFKDMLKNYNFYNTHRFFGYF
ncbi:MAG: hypothetical protein AAF599_06150, partial [Bacteroidota bacterium]